LLGHALDPRRITHLLTASCTGFHAPGFDVHLVKSLNLRRTVHRTHVGFMGCFAGFSTLKLADAICRADPDALVLIVHVELCTLHVRFDPARDVQVANAIFGDGAAAALVAGDRSVAHWPRGPAFRTLNATSHLLPDSEEEMSWNIGDQGFEMRLSPRVPSLLRRHLPEVFQHSIDAMRLSRDDIRHWAIHPGGPAIVDRARQALDLDESDVQISRDVLREHGNMSSATLWFLLDRIKQRETSGMVFACGFGPGLTVESATLQYEGAAAP
jgi:predicted naringenin-chalcone synthase